MQGDGECASGSPTAWNLPPGRKITALAAVAEAAGFSVESVDFTSTRDAEERRVAILLARQPTADGPLVPASSSVSVAARERALADP